MTTTYPSSNTQTDRAGDPSQPLVELRSMTLQFSRQTILNKITLSIPRGQTLVVIGESGCGKTMLLKTVVGLTRPRSGQVVYDGDDIHTLNDHDLTNLRCKFGFVFQNAALFDSMTIGQNIAFPLQQHDLAQGRDVNRIVFDRLAEVGLPDSVAAKRPAQLSGGMRKRVGLARALVLEPELMLYDEPTTGLDPIMSDVINELMLRTSAKPDVTSLIITHDMKTAYKVADRVIMLYPFSRLEKGEDQIIFDGTPQELEQASDRRVRQFVNGEAGERLMELRSSALENFE
ncbi:MAG: ATP-binding cassette domain-containing protein [Pirellulaceae bacterium]|jgi:phospholipid/cholesterol/gamma-HCH transport system ATP-binding protein|nr:ATP-binding cassette domain-containing protein [Pirellulaceae bacterium]